MLEVKEACVWPAPGSEDSELGLLMELEVGHGETEVYEGVQELDLPRVIADVSNELSTPIRRLLAELFEDLHRLEGRIAGKLSN